MSAASNQNAFMGLVMLSQLMDQNSRSHITEILEIISNSQGFRNLSSSVLSSTADSLFDDRFTSENLLISELEIQVWCKAKKTPISLILNYTKMWCENGRFPSLDDMVEYYLDRACICMRNYQESDQKALIKDYLCNIGVLPSCMETKAWMEYYILHGHSIPSREELLITIDRMIQMEESATDFHESDKKDNPVANLNKIKSTCVKEGGDCTICLEPIKPNSKCFVMSPCKHVFHAVAKDCLDTCDVTDWFKKHRTCPVCRTEIKIEDDSVELASSASSSSSSK